MFSLLKAHHHLSAVQAIVTIDPVGAYQLLYDSARKALAAVLENEGLRATSRGGHIAVLDAVSAQLDPPLGPILRPFDRLGAAAIRPSIQRSTARVLIRTWCCVTYPRCWTSSMRPRKCSTR
jgi:hypothetical protein